MSGIPLTLQCSVWPLACGESKTCIALAGFGWFATPEGLGVTCPLFSEQTQESIQRFEQQAGLRDAGYTPHKGLTTEETKYLRVAEALHVSKQGHHSEVQLWVTCQAAVESDRKSPGSPC